MPGLLGLCLRTQTTRLPNTFSSPSHQRASWAVLPGPGHCPAAQGRPCLPGLSSVPAQGSEEEESCTSEVTTSLSEEVLDLRGAERFQKGASQVFGQGGAGGGQRNGVVQSPGPLGRQSLVVTSELRPLDADSRDDPKG